jgi:hypothetical protein
MRRTARVGSRRRNHTLFERGDRLADSFLTGRGVDGVDAGGRDWELAPGTPAPRLLRQKGQTAAVSCTTLLQCRQRFIGSFLDGEKLLAPA